MVWKKLLRSSPALIVILIFFLTTNLYSIGSPKIGSSLEKLQERKKDVLLQGKNNRIPSSFKNILDGRFPSSDKTSLQGENPRIPSSYRTSLQEDGRINPLLEETATTTANPTPFHEARTAIKTAMSGVINSKLRLSSRNKTLKELPHTSGGYLLSHDYWEQLTAGSRNLFTLQCWAGGLNMSVVEPFVKKTDLYSTTEHKGAKNLLKFSDVYDIDHWNAFSRKANSSPLVPWVDFIEKAPRNLITVNINYGATKRVPEQEWTLYKEGCSHKASWNNLVQFLEQKHKFTVVRKICINFSHGKEFGPSEFYEEVFGSNKPSNSTVLFGQWRGLSTRRVQVRGTGCNAPKATVDAEPSKMVLRDAERYRDQYLRTHDYVAIFARMEKAKQQKKQQGTVTNCFHETLESWRRMVSTTEINTTFLSTDVGRLGSASFKTAKDDFHGAFSEFFATIYGDKLTVDQWESNFESVSGVSHPGYIGILQKAIAAQANCVLFVGGGSFQRNALNLYRKKHAKEDWCIYVVEDCTESKLV